jgi:hypothetical protein
MVHRAQERFATRVLGLLVYPARRAGLPPIEVDPAVTEDAPVDRVAKQFGLGKCHTRLALCLSVGHCQSLETPRMDKRALPANLGGSQSPWPKISDDARSGRHQPAPAAAAFRGVTAVSLHARRGRLLCALLPPHPTIDFATLLGRYVIAASLSFFEPFTRRSRRLRDCPRCHDGPDAGGGVARLARPLPLHLLPAAARTCCHLRCSLRTTTRVAPDWSQ